MKKEKNKNMIPTSFYNRILSVIPVPCVDLVIVHKGKFLMGKRINEPAKGQWFFPGGRVFKEETLEQAAVRKAKEETGIKIKKSNLNYLTTAETIFRAKNFSGTRHTINSVFLVKPDKLKESELLKFDRTQNSEFQWFSKIDKNWYPYVKNVLKLAGFGQ